MAVIIGTPNHLGKHTTPVKPQKTNINEILNFHNSIPGYKKTPLVSLPTLSNKLGIGKLYIKNESNRFNLNAFKALGGSYALARIIAKAHNMPASQLTIDNLRRNCKQSMTFVTATAGNHGIGVAWTAKLLNQKAVVTMPKGTPNGQVNTIKALGAKAIVTEMNYDDTVDYTRILADDNHWHLVQDTAWDGYDTIPAWIMQGYYTMVHEMVQQYHSKENTPPSHLFLQAGVGSMAAGVIDYLSAHSDLSRTKIIITEPIHANCYYQSISKGVRTPSYSDSRSIMNGLDCAITNPIAWPSIQNHCYYCLSADDTVANLGIELLSSPRNQDTAIASGPSGAINIGLLYNIMLDTKHQSIKRDLSLSKDSTVLCINTECNPTTFTLNESSACEKIEPSMLID